jgi:hypothetical protein
MKKIILMCVVALSVLGADAQTKKGKKSRKTSNKEAIANAKFNKMESQKKLMRDSLMITMRSDDSLRLVTDSLSDVQKDSLSVAYKTTGLQQIDSIKKEKFSSIAQERARFDKSARDAAEITSAAKLNVYQSRQIIVINQSYNEKAKAITASATVDEIQKKQQLIALNTERLKRIEAIAGKGKAKKLEKERREYTQKNGADTDSAWIDMAESYAKNK